MIINSHFDMMKTLGKSSYINVHNNDKSKTLFMVNRMLSRCYPVLAAMMSHMKMDSISAMDFWHNHFKLIRSMGGNPLPGELYAKLGAPKTIKDKYSNDAVNFVINKWQISLKEFIIMKELKSKELIKYLNSVDKMLNEKLINK